VIRFLLLRNVPRKAAEQQQPERVLLRFPRLYEIFKDIKVMVCYVAVLFFFISVSAFGAQELDCDREVPDDLYELKENHIPVEFHHEPFSMEIVDLGMLVLLMSVATWFSIKHKPSSWLSFLMLAGLLYFGFFRGGCICPVGATTNFCIGLAAPELIGRVVAILFLLPLLFAYFAGRVFCSSGCPLGALQHLLARKKSVQLPARINSVVRLLPIALLFATAWGALRGGLFIACKMDVYKWLFFTGYAWIDQLMLWVKGALVESRIIFVGDVVAWTVLGCVLVLGYFVPRPFCRLVCPYGVLLGTVSTLGLRNREIDPSACMNCKMCEKKCPVQAIHSDPTGKLVSVSDFHCIQCGRCDDVCRKSGLRG